MEDKLDRILGVIDEAKKDKGFDRILSWMEKHPILSVLILYIFVSKITKTINKKYQGG